MPNETVILTPKQVVENQLWNVAGILTYNPTTGMSLHDRRSGAIVKVSDPLPDDPGGPGTTTTLSKYIRRCIDYAYGVNNILVVTPLINTSPELTRLTLDLFKAAARNQPQSLEQRILITCAPFEYDACHFAKDLENCVRIL